MNIIEANKQAHQFFLKRFGELHEQYQESDTSVEVVIDTFEELAAWIIEHIVRIDSKLADYVKDE